MARGVDGDILAAFSQTALDSEIVGVRPRGWEELARMGWVVGVGTGGVIVGGKGYILYDSGDCPLGLED